MRCIAVFTSVLLSASAYAAGNEDFYKAYSVVSAAGALPIRNIVVKRVGDAFTSYRGFQVDCDSHLISETGFYSSPDAALKELLALQPSEKTFKLLTAEVWAKACGTEQTISALK